MNMEISDKIVTKKTKLATHHNNAMKAIIFSEFGGPEVLKLAQVNKPDPDDQQLLIKVHAAAINRADLIIRGGKYSATLNEPEILGLEVAGEVVSVGKNATQFAVGQRVFGLINGGGYAEYCLLDKELAMPIPERWSYIEAASVPEAFFTADETIFNLGELKPQESILIHAAGSGVGTAAVQMAHHIGATVYFTAGSQQKIDRILALGGTQGINYKTHDFAEEIMRISEGNGVDVIEDFIGASFFARNIKVLKKAGRLILVGLMGGRITEVDLSEIVYERLRIIGSVLRSRSLQDKRIICKRFQERWLPVLKSGAIKPVIDSVYRLEEVRSAHIRMQNNENFGKIVLQISEVM